MELQVQLSEYLGDLGLEALAGQQYSVQTGPPCQFPVSSEQHPAFSTGQAHQLMIIHIWIKAGIVSKDTQPLGQCANHSIGDESHE